MARYRLTISYDGGDFEGFQIQPDKITVEGEIEKALSKRFCQVVDIVASGRTDSGAHALGQVAHFDMDKEFDMDNFVYSINCMLPDSIVILNCEKVADDFHARYDAVSKTYIYKVALSKTHCPLKRKYYYICGYDVDIDAMRKACKYFVGQHDFRSFMMADDDKENTVREITDLHIDSRLDPQDNCTELWFFVEGNGFLHNMVRIIVGTLIDVGRGRFAVEDIPKIVEAKKRSAAGKTLDACALYLKEVRY